MNESSILMLPPLPQSSSDTATPASYRYFLWNITDNQPLASGDVLIKPAAKTVAA